MIKSFPKWVKKCPKMKKRQWILNMILLNLATMSEDIDKIVKSKFKTVENDGLGGSKVKKLEIGDLVSWNSWADTLDTNVFEERNGILMDILTESRIGGEKYMAKILPFGSNLPVIIPLIIVRKSKLRN